jgi:AcrR family transcriptional regulator
MSECGTPASEGTRSRAKKRAESRRRILDSAREVFFRDGFMVANLDEVAERAGVAKGTLYRYFDNKADLYVGVLADNGQVFTERMRETARGDGTALERLRRVARFYFDHWTKHEQYFQIFWAIDNQNVIGTLPPGVVEEVSRLWESCVSIVDEVVGEGVRGGEFVECDSWAVANFLWTSANAVIQSDRTEMRRKIRRGSLEDLYSLAVEVILDGLQKPAA